MKKTIDQLAADAARKYALCMQMEKACVENGDSPEFQQKLKQTEEDWQLAHSLWEDGLQEFADQLQGAVV